MLFSSHPHDQPLYLQHQFHRHRPCLSRSVSFENDISEEIIDNSTESQISAGELEKTEITDKSAMDDEKEYMKL